MQTAKEPQTSSLNHLGVANFLTSYALNQLHRASLSLVKDSERLVIDYNDFTDPFQPSAALAPVGSDPAQQSSHTFTYGSG